MNFEHGPYLQTILGYHNRGVFLWVVRFILGDMKWSLHRCRECGERYCEICRSANISNARGYCSTQCQSDDESRQESLMQRLRVECGWGKGVISGGGG